jgi:hypothetical protein
MRLGGPVPEQVPSSHTVKIVAAVIIQVAESVAVADVIEQAPVIFQAEAVAYAVDVVNANAVKAETVVAGGNQERFAHDHCVSPPLRQYQRYSAGTGVW